MDLYKTRSDLFIDGVLVALDDLAAEGDGTLLVDVFQQLVIVNDNLEHAVFVADVQKHNAAVVADIFHPAGYAHLLTDILFS